MKLLIIIDDLFSAGTENVLASRLANISDDIDVHIVTLYARGAIADIIEGLGFSVEFIDLESCGYRKGIRAVKRIIERENPDIALCMRDVARGLFPWFLKKSLPVVMFWDNPRIQRSFRQSIAEWFQVRFSNPYMYCCTNATRVALRKIYGAKEIGVIPNCYDSRKFKSDSSLNDVKSPLLGGVRAETPEEEMSLRSKRSAKAERRGCPVLTPNQETQRRDVKSFEIISIGHIREEKKHAAKISIASRLKELGVDFKLEIIGKGDLDKLQSMIADHGLQNEISLPGECDDIAERLRSSHLFLLTSISEGFPVALLEAMASGLPCITYHFPGLEEIDKDFSHLEVIAQGDIDSAVEKIMYYADNPEECRKLGKKAAEHIAEHFSAQVNTRKWEEYLISIQANNSLSAEESFFL